MASTRRGDDDGILVEVVPWDEGGPEPEARRECRERREGPAARTRRYRALALAGVVVLAAGLAQAVEDRRDARRDVEAAAMVGTVPVIEDELEAVWQQPPWFSAYQGLGDVVVLFRSGSSVRGIDGATGRERWTLPEPVLGCWPTDVPRVAGAAGESPALVCRGRSAGTGSPDVMARLLLVEGATGEVLGEHVVATPSYAPVTVGHDVVLVHAEREGLSVVRRGMVDGAVRWRTTVPGDARGSSGRVEARHGMVVLQGPVSAVLAADDGAVLGAWRTGAGDAAAGEPPDVRVQRRGFTVRGPGEAGTAWYGRDGDLVATVPGYPVEPLVTDDSDEDVLLSVTPGLDTLVAFRREDGAELWRVPYRTGNALVVRDGALVVARADEVVSVDLRTGSARWRTPVVEVSPRSGAVTDGRTVVVAADLGRSSRLVALDLDAGDVAWSVPMPAVPSRPDGVTHDFPWVWLGSLGGRAVVLGEAGLTGLG